MMKAKLILIAFCLCVIGASQLYFKGFRDSEEYEKQVAFDDYVNFARQMKVETHKKPAKIKADDIFARAGF